MSNEKEKNSKQEDNATNKPQDNPVDNSQLKKKPKPPKFNVYWIYGIIALAFFGIQFLNIGHSATDITWDKLEKMLKIGDIEKIVVINNEQAEIYLRPDKIDQEKYKDLFKGGINGVSKQGPHFFYKYGSIESLEKRLELVQAGSKSPISVDFDPRKDYMGEIISWVFPIVLLVVIWLFIFRKMGGGGAGNIFSIGKSKAKVFNKEEADIKVNFNDVAGLQEAKVEITEIVDFLKNPTKYTKLGGKIPKGALLVGPPGTGKTLLAKAVAGEANVPFFSMSGSDFVEMFVGVGASRVRDLFAQAKEKAPCIIFIDEIDAIGRARGRNPNFGSNDERENTLNQLLTEMDGFDTNTGVIILAATNRADILDRALMRAGRFDRQIHVELPDIKERKDIFKVHLRPIKVDEHLDVEFLAKQTPGFSGADIANVCNEAALIAARKDKVDVGKEDFLAAVDRIVGGLEKKNKIITIEEKKTIAYHEAGHATVSWLLEYANPLVKVTIVPRGSSLGAAWYLPEERQITTQEQILDEICSLLGGRVAEEIVFGKISTGALNDLEKVTKQAYAMVIYFGMSPKIGNLSFFDSSGQNDYAFNKPYSDKTADLIDKEVYEIVDIAYQRAKTILLQHRDGLTQLGELLLEREVIFTEDVERIFGKKNGTHHALYEKEEEIKVEEPKIII